MSTIGIIRAGWHIASVANMTCKVIAPDNTTVRHTGITMDDSGEAKLYSNTQAVDNIVAGDTVQVFIGTVLAGTLEYTGESDTTDDYILSAGYIGDYKLGNTIYFFFNTTSTLTGGTLEIFKSESDTALVGTGAAIDYDFGHADIHQVSIPLPSSVFDEDADYSVVLNGASINGLTVTAILGIFSVENRFQSHKHRYISE